MLFPNFSILPVNFKISTIAHRLRIGIKAQTFYLLEKPMFNFRNAEQLPQISMETTMKHQRMDDKGDKLYNTYILFLNNKIHK